MHHCTYGSRNTEKRCTIWSVRSIGTCSFTLLTRSMGCYDIKVGSCISPTCDALMAHLFCLWRGSKLFCQPFVLWPGMNLSQLLGGELSMAGCLGPWEVWNVWMMLDLLILDLNNNNNNDNNNNNNHHQFYIQYPYLWKILTACTRWSLRRLFEAIQVAQYSLASLILRVSFHDCMPMKTKANQWYHYISTCKYKSDPSVAVNNSRCSSRVGTALAK